MLLALVSAGFVGCSDDNDIKTDKVPSAVRDTMAEMFPKATNIDWDLKYSYYVADFRLDNLETDAWFSKNGDWTMTETDYNKSIAMLPEAVQEAFKASDYATLTIDDVDYYKRLTDSFSAIEVDVNGGPDVTMYIDDAGKVINIVNGDHKDILPDTDITKL